MNRFVISGLLVLIIFNASAQPRERVFRTAGDSIAFERNETFLRSLLNPQEQREVADSLMAIRSAILDRGFLGWRRHYTSTESFTPYHNLANGTVSAVDVRQLSISGAAIRKIPKALYACTNLSVLELVNTSIKKVPGRLNKLKSLTTLSIYNNRSPKALKLSRNTTVRFLKIRSSHLDQCATDLSRLRALDSADLAENFLTRFPKLARKHHLKELILNENLITLDKLKVHPNKTLEVLHLRRNKIAHVPNSFANFVNLRKVTFNHNSIRSIGEDISKLSRLEELSLYQNVLTSIPACIYALTSLKEIDLYYNKVEKVDSAIGNLRNLNVLYLANNEIRTLPETLGSLSQLRELYVHHNRISLFPNSLANLSTLQVLRFNDNFFAELPAQVLKLKNLTNLDCSNNNIQELPPSLLELTKLNMLIIRGNPWLEKDDVEDLAAQFRERGTRVNLTSGEGAGKVVFRDY
jgi:Leucine-rich repeat (LRR) protein